MDNFCWPGCDDEVRMGELVRASLACYDGATAYGAPFISGKDSLNNQFRTEEGDVIRIPPTLLISGFAPVEAERFVTSMDAKSAGNVLMLVGVTTADLGGAHVTELAGGILPGGSGEIPLLDLQAGPANAKAVARGDVLVQNGAGDYDFRTDYRRARGRVHGKVREFQRYAQVLRVRGQGR